MNRLGRVQKMAARSRRSERGCHLLRYETGFAHAAGNHAARTAEDGIRRAAEFDVQSPGNAPQRARLDLDNLARIVERIKTSRGVNGGRRLRHVKSKENGLPRGDRGNRRGIVSVPENSGNVNSKPSPLVPS